MTKKTILIIEEQPLYREALSELIINSFDVKKTYKTTDIDNILTLIKGHKIDLITLDVTLPDNDGINLAKTIKAHNYEGKILFISSIDNPSLSSAALDLGADGFLSKNESHEAIIFALSSVMKGYSLFKHNHNKKTQSTKLSTKEAIVFQYLIQGHSNKIISERLSLSAKTISTYKTRILNKYKANSMIELIQFNSTL